MMTLAEWIFIGVKQMGAYQFHGFGGLHAVPMNKAYVEWATPANDEIY